MTISTVCNSTLEDMRIGPTSEVKIVGPLTFHGLAIVISGGASFIAVVVSLFLIVMHATHYTRPREQKEIIRILFMVPVYAVASFLALSFYWEAVYYDVLSNCYEAFAISSFFSLICHYIAPTLREQKQFFRQLGDIKDWVLPISWFRKCCGGDRGIWRTPRSGLTTFNIVWIGVYQYCFIRVSTTIIAVVTQYFNVYCESSWSPVFAYVWCNVFVTISVTIAMYCLIQLYWQTKDILKEFHIFLKVLAIKLVIFLSFWQTLVIAAATSSVLGLVHPSSTLAYPDLKVGIPNLILCVEMAIFAVMHIWAFPYAPYRVDAKVAYYPLPDGAMGDMTRRENARYPRSQGGTLGWRALLDAANPWDIIKAFGRGMRWLFVGAKHRHEDVSYQTTRKNSANVEVGMDDLRAGAQKPGAGNPFDDQDTAYPSSPYAYGAGRGAAVSTAHLPGGFDAGYGPHGGGRGGARHPRPLAGDMGEDAQPGEESAGLIAHAQPNPSSVRRNETSPYRDNNDRYMQHSYPPSPQPHPADPFQDQQIYEDPSSQDPFRGRTQRLHHQQQQQQQQQQPQPQGDFDGEMVSSPIEYEPGVAAYGGGGVNRTSTQMRVGQALWGPRLGQPGGGPYPEPHDEPPPHAF